MGGWEDEKKIVSEGLRGQRERESEREGVLPTGMHQPPIHPPTHPTQDVPPQAGCQCSGWWAEMERQIFLPTSKRPLGCWIG